MNRRMVVMLVGLIFSIIYIGQAMANGNWEVKILNPDSVVVVPGDDHLTVEVSSPEMQEQKVDVCYTVKQVVKSDRIYHPREDGGYRVEDKDIETKDVLQDRQEIVIKKTGDGKQKGVLKIPVESIPYGLIRLEILVRNKEGQELNKTLTYFNKVVSVPYEKIVDNIAGLDDYGWLYYIGKEPDDWGNRQLTKYGFSWVHMRARWYETYLEKGKITHLEYLDKWVDAARKQNAKIIMMLADGPMHLLPGDAEHWDMEYFKEWAEAIISRYKDKVDVWDVWNEPECKSYAMAEDRDIQAIKIVYELKEKYCPNTKVIVSPHSNYLGVNYLKRIFEKGAGEYLDGVGIHPYRVNAPEVDLSMVSELEKVYQLLLKYNVEPNIYIDEMQYALNLQPYFDENDQANFMVRSTILAKTKKYVKSFVHHAFGNGRLAPPTYPNMVCHIMNTDYVQDLSISDAEVYAFLFKKTDGSGKLILPVWAAGTDRIVKISGVVEKPRVVDIYGNTLDSNVIYNRDECVLDFVKISQAPIYITMSERSTPSVSISKLVEINYPSQVMSGKTFTITAKVNLLPEESQWKLKLQTLPDWEVEPQVISIDKVGSYDFIVKIPETTEPDSYPVLCLVLDNKDKELAIEDGKITVIPSSEVMKSKYGITLFYDFESSGLKGISIQKTAQGEVDIFNDMGNNVLRVVHKGIDFPVTLGMKSEQAEYDVIELDFKFLSREEFFELLMGDIRIRFTEQGSINLLKGSDAVKITDFVVDRWNKIRVFFSVSEGWIRVWLNDRFCGIGDVEKISNFSDIKLVSGALQAKENPVLLYDNIRMAKIDPPDISSGVPLQWSICGPFPNVPDPNTMKRPFEMDVDYLEPCGGENTVFPYPGMDVPFDGITRTFLPFFTAAQNKTDFLISFPAIDKKFQDVDILCYAVAYFVSPEEKEITITISSDDGHALWVNNTFLGKFNAWPTGASIGQFPQKYKVKIRKGLNIILVKVDQGLGLYGFLYNFE
ncbi:MAG: hypothetical protein N3D17_06695 [bacterium]|nr:hypothetical protein [bacterium]